MRVPQRSGEIDMRGARPDPGLEVVELAAAHGPPQPLFAALDALPEPPYQPRADDPIGCAGLWRALGSL